MSQPLPFSSVPHCHKPCFPQKRSSSNVFSIRNCERPFHEVIRQKRQSPGSFFERSETPAVVVRLRAIPTVKRRLAQPHHPFL